VLVVTSTSQGDSTLAIMMARGGEYTCGSARSVETSGRTLLSIRGIEMAGPIKHVYKKRAMVKFGKMKGRELFEFQEILYYLNNYIGVNGKPNKQTGTTPPQLSSLIKIHPDFKYHPDESKWEYIGPLDDNEIEKQ